MRTLPQVFHPTSGFHYVMEVPFDDHVPMADVRKLYQEVASRTPWVSVMNRLDFNNFYDSGAPETDDERYFFVLWDLRPLSPRRDRKGFFAPVYLEPLGGEILPAHDMYKRTFTSMMEDCDASFGHTPWVADQLASLTKKPAFAFPLGWSPLQAVDGVSKVMDLSYHGIYFGRRETLLGELQRELPELVQISGFGTEILHKIAASKANLYIPHCNPTTLSTWRIWQMVTVGNTALMIQPGDCWPMTPDHYLPISPIVEGRIGVTVEEVRGHLRSSDLVAGARQMRNDLGPDYTVDRCISNYLVPASEQIRAARSR